MAIISPRKMRRFLKALTFVALVAAATLLAAAYGALHDQLSYTVSTEYYTRFKFDEFAWAAVGQIPPRLGAAAVGMLATWWVGAVAGIAIAGAGLLHRGPAEMVRTTFRAYGILALGAVALGLVGLAVGWIGYGANEAAHLADWWHPSGLVSPHRFFAAGMMHNGSYLGGAIGAILAVRYQLRTARRSAREDRAARRDVVPGA